MGNGGHLAGIKLKGLNRYHSRRNKIQTETKTSHEDLHQYLSAPKKSTFKNHSKALLKSTKESLLILQKVLGKRLNSNVTMLDSEQKRSSTSKLFLMDTKIMGCNEEGLNPPKIAF